MKSSETVHRSVQAGKEGNDYFHKMTWIIASVYDLFSQNKEGGKRYVNLIYGKRRDDAIRQFLVFSMCFYCLKALY